MIILFKDYGHYSNRLFQNLHFEAFCLEHQIPYANATFFDIQDYYQDSATTIKDQFAQLMKTRLFTNLAKLRLFKHVIYFEEDHKFNPSILFNFANQKGYVAGWGFRVHHLTQKYQDLFIQKYSLKQKFYVQNLLFQELSRINRNTTAVIAVHMRRGNYRSWMEGKYFFEDELYQKHMHNLEAQVAKKHQKKTFFLVFSNETTSFVDGANIRVSHNPWYLDHLCMSQCDYLIGPPSTFTLWASYLGKTKFFHIKGDSGTIDLDQFTYCTG